MSSNYTQHIVQRVYIDFLYLIAIVVMSHQNLTFSAEIIVLLHSVYYYIHHISYNHLMLFVS